ncbi:hypothetical protein [Enemella dayhoffiae]|uniref:hypothetical protein n=1 Tax=Enemella dayhoffiae TaxID=2016507 RepID=UPI001E4C637C|nr:hypothetical protein [Enemella dayhoffiae]
MTHDVSTMLGFAYGRVAAGLFMPGVLEIPDQTPRSVIIDELLLIAAASQPEEWRDTVRYLPLR